MIMICRLHFVFKWSVVSSYNLHIVVERKRANRSHVQGKQITRTLTRRGRPVNLYAVAAASCWTCRGSGGYRSRGKRRRRRWRWGRYEDDLGGLQQGSQRWRRVDEATAASTGVGRPDQQRLYGAQRCPGVRLWLGEWTGERERIKDQRMRRTSPTNSP